MKLRKLAIFLFFQIIALLKAWITQLGSKLTKPFSNHECASSIQLDHSEISEDCAIKLLQEYIEPVIRKVVREEVHAALWKPSLGNAICSSNDSSTEQTERPDQWNLWLQFESVLPTFIYTEENVEAEQGGAIKVVLLDASTGCVRTSGPESSLKLEVVVLEGDFNNKKDEAWTEEEFEAHVVKHREGKRHLLQGDLHVKLNKGVGILVNNSFTDNSSWVRSKKFRIGAKVAPRCWNGRRIQEATTNPFRVKDRRGKPYEKHYPPAPDDPVWRLANISMGGIFHKRLEEAKISTVRDILLMDSANLRKILGNSMSDKMWGDLEKHASTCALDGKLYVSHHDDSRNVGVISNDTYESEALINDGSNNLVDSFSEDMKVYEDKLVKEANDNSEHITEYVNFNQSTCISDLQETAASFATPIPIEPPGGNASNGDPTTKYVADPLHSPSSSSQIEPMSIYKETDTLTNDVFQSFSVLGSIDGFLPSVLANPYIYDDWLLGSNANVGQVGPSGALF